MCHLLYILNGKFNYDPNFNWEMFEKEEKKILDWKTKFKSL